MTTFLFTFLSLMCTISIAWGCVSGAGPSWEIGHQPGRSSGGRRRPAAKQHSQRIGTAMKTSSSTGRGQSVLSFLPRIPVEVMRYFGGTMSKELAFASIDLDGNGLVSFSEWTSKGGASTEFNHMLLRLDTNGDNQISLTELQPFSLPNSNTDTLTVELPQDTLLDLPRDRLRHLPHGLTRDRPRDFPRRLPHDHDLPLNRVRDLPPRDLPRDMPWDLPQRRNRPRGPFQL